MNSKKILSWFLTVAMMVTMIPTAVFAAYSEENTVYIDTINAQTLSPGDTVYLPVMIENNAGFSNYDLAVSYDDAALSLTGITSQNGTRTYVDIDDAMYSYNESSYSMTVSASNGTFSWADGSFSWAEDGSFAYLKFTVNSDAVNDDYAVSIMANPDTDVVNVAGDEGIRYTVGNDTTYRDVNYVTTTVKVTGGTDASTGTEGTGTEETTPTFDSDGYALQVEIEDTQYNVGDTITADIVAYADAETDDADTAVFGSFGLELDYDSDDLALDSFTSTHTYQVGTENMAKMAGTFATDQTISTEGTTIATATFTVNSTIDTGTSETTVDLTTANINLAGTNTDNGWDVTTDTAALYNLTVTFNNGSDGGTATTTGAAGITYVKYDDDTLYTSNGYTNEADLTAIKAEDGYSLASDLWLNDDVADNYYADTDTFTANASYTAQTDSVYTITLGSVTNGSWTTGSTGTTIKVVSDTALSAVTGVSVDASDNYVFSYYTVGTSDDALDDTYTVTGNITLNAVCVADTFAFNEPTVTNGTYTPDSGVTNNETTYGEDLKFTITPNSGYVVTSVTYTVDNGSSTTLTATETNATSYAKSYTIGGESIIGEIAIIVETAAYYTITFEDVVGVTLNSADADVVLYTLGSGQALYSSPADIGVSGSTTDIPTVTADDGYRVYDGTTDASASHLWSSSDSTESSGITSSAITSKTFNANTTYIAQAVKQYVVTFEIDGGNGSINNNATTSITVDADYALTESDFPSVTANTGYQFAGWSADVEDVIETTTTVTGSFELGTYLVSITGDSVATIETTSGVTEGYAEYLTPVTFTVTALANQAITSVTVKVDGEDITITDNENGAYTIAGTDITGAVSIIVAGENTSTLTFSVATGESMGSVSSKSYTIAENETFSDADIDTDDIDALASPSTGYKFLGWYLSTDSTKTIVTLSDITVGADNTTYYAKFGYVDYTISFANGEYTNKTDAHIGDTFTFTPAISGSYIYAVSATLDSDNSTVAVTDNGDGSYSITVGSGDISVTTSSFAGSLSVIENSDYKVLGNDKEILVLKTTKLDNNTQYELADKTFFWSDEYNAYVQIVAASSTYEEMTNAAIGTLFTVLDTVATDLAYNGDINLSGGVTAIDAGMVNDLLQGYTATYTITDRILLEADVNGTSVVTTNDINWILNLAVGNSNEGND